MFNILKSLVVNIKKDKYKIGGQLKNYYKNQFEVWVY